jgi:hypothetical protein
MGGGRTKGVLFGLLWLAGAWVHQAPENPNATSRLDLLHALVSQGTWHLDVYHENTTNKAWCEGHYYSDKPPGLVFLALPTFLLLHLFLQDSLESKWGWLLSSWLGSAGATGLWAATGAVACFSWLSRSHSRRIALLTTLAFFLGTPLLAYAGSWFPHSATVGLLFVALNIAHRDFPKIGSVSRRWWLMAGLVCGLALSCEYSAAIPLVAVGGVCFGTPWTIPYQHTATLTHMQQGLCGILFPPPASHLTHLVLGSTRGLFMHSPFLLCLWVGFRQLHERSPAWFYSAYVIVLLQWILMSGYGDLAAGNTLGPRLLLCALPWLALPTALAFSQYPRASTALVGVAVLVNAAALWSGIELLPTASLWETVLERFSSGNTPHHLGELFGLTALASALCWASALLAGIAWLWRSTQP